ncbi:MAG: M14 family metallopeptidase, partial [Candidatus Neomarinimicrobiota bacterium]
MKRNFIFLSFTYLLAEQTIDLPLKIEGVTYDSTIPYPEEIMGHKIGTRHTRPDQVVDYFEAIAAISDRVLLEDHGLTHEGRRLFHALVTHPENHEKLETIRKQNLKISDTPAAINDQDLNDMPLVAYLGFSIHGDEASGTEAAILLLHYLASGSGSGVDEVLKNCVFIIDPMFNPDGRSRFVNWINGNRGYVPTSDLQDREHNQPWPRGRTNHYLFDLNRDWMPLTQPESAGRVQLFHHWRPQFLLDVHEMGKDATYFFQPGIPSRNNPNTPEMAIELTKKLSKYFAKNLDRIGSLYFSEEIFDDFFYGKGSTFGDIHGSVGVLFEQASTRALKTETDMGILSYSFTIRNQFIATLGTLEGLTAMRKEFLKYQRDFYANSKSEFKKNRIKGYLINLKDNSIRAQLMLRNLQQHRIKIHTLKKSHRVKGKNFKPGEAAILSMDQSQTRFIKALMERVTTFRDSIFYDISAWTLPLAYGVETFELRQNPSALIGKELDPIQLEGGSITGGKADIAYLLEWGGYYSPRALYRVLDEGLHPRLAKEPFTAMINGQKQYFERGTIIIPVVQRDGESLITAEDIHSLVKIMAAEDHVNIYAANSSLTQAGADLGGRLQPVLKKPKVALLSGKSTTSYDVGETWHLLSERMGIPVSLLDIGQVSNITLSKYNTLVMVRGTYAEFDTTDMKVLKQWIKLGGTLITTGSASKFVIQKKIVSEKLIKVPRDTLDILYENVSKTTGAQRLSGSIFEALLDNTHPVAYGYGKSVPVFKNDTSFYDLSIKTASNVARYAESPLLSGYISDRNLERIKGTASIIARKQGKGRVILFGDNP